MSAGPQVQQHDERIESWKAIASLLGRDERTVKRWEKERSLPIRRMPGNRGGVFAFRTELMAWRDSRLAHGSGQHAAHTEESSAAAPVVQPEFEASLPSQMVAAPVAALVATRPQARWGIVTMGAISVLFLTAIMAWAGMRLGPLRQAAAAEKGLRDSTARRAARDNYLMGRYYWERRTDGSLKQAVDAFTQAVVHDPTYAPGYAGLAESYDLMPEFSSMPATEAYPRAIAAAQKAIELDDTMASAHRALGFARFYWNVDVPGAEKELTRAIELNPADVEAHHWYATVLFTLARFKEAQGEIDKARDLAPTSRAILADKALIDFWSGDREAGIARLEELQRAEPQFVSAPRYLSGAYYFLHEDERSIDALKRAAAISKDPNESEIAEAEAQGLASGGRNGMMLAVRRIAQKRFDAGQDTGWELGITCARLGDRKCAVDAMNEAFKKHDFLLLVIFHGDIQTVLRGYLPFEQLEDKVRLWEDGSPLDLANSRDHSF